MLYSPSLYPPQVFSYETNRGGACAKFFGNRAVRPALTNPVSDFLGLFHRHGGGASSPGLGRTKPSAIGMAVVLSAGNPFKVIDSVVPFVTVPVVALLGSSRRSFECLKHKTMGHFLAARFAMVEHVTKVAASVPKGPQDLADPIALATSMRNEAATSPDRTDLVDAFPANDRLPFFGGVHGMNYITTEVA